VTTVDFDIYLPQKFEKKEVDLFAMLGGSQVLSGAEELRRVGRCLDWLYPNELERVVRRDSELEKLTELLNAKDQRPVVIIGKRQVGKTAVINEFVYRQVAKRSQPRQNKRNTWLIAPQRLISGMMYVGQWEERLLAILKEAKEKEHLLYFDDLLGLFLAGVSASSDLNVAQVLKPYIERRDVRILAEITPEAWRVFQEKDRSLADLFQVVRLAETNEDETLRVVLSVRRELEHKQKCRFALETLPTALDLQRRYVRDAAFPGKAAVFLNQLAVKFRDGEIKREDVLREFQTKSGMNVSFLDDRELLQREDIIKKISAGVIGQNAAVEAAADVISMAKARLNDGARPLASFLFLGATGVGKTEAAKQIAKYLYGSEEKLLRFDMNEFVSPFDAARLVGTFDQPEGLLTGAIRRQPFAVILLDEIEKAHPDVFNLLLQVMGDGRLTDALGRTADFTNAIIILTSNLGAREANVKLGFRQTNESDAHVYRQAAEKFFKPEFFNRLDRVIPFERLRREEVEKIAEILLQKLYSREGLLRRNCKLNLAPAAMNLIVNEGYHPSLGARALKRALEKNLVQPIAAKLAALSPDAPTMIRMDAHRGQITVQVEEIKPLTVEQSVWLTRDFSNIDHELDLIADTLNRLEDQIKHLKPSGEINPHDLQQARYFLIQEHIKRVDRMLERAEKFQNSTAKNKATRQRSARHLITLRESGVDFGKFLSSSNLSALLKKLTEENRIFGDQTADYIQDIWRETALLQSIVKNATTSEKEKCLLAIWTTEHHGEKPAKYLAKLYHRIFSHELGLKSELLETASPQLEKFLQLEGACAFDLAQAENGIHLIINSDEGLLPLSVVTFKINSNDSPTDFSAKFAQIRHENLNQQQPVVRLYEEIYETFRATLDFRSGLLTDGELTERELRTFLLSGLL
jgi:ATP-dependent Clp protease ATP-binding subunit ClpA